MLTFSSSAAERPLPCNSFWVNHLSMLLVYLFLCYYYIYDPQVILRYTLLIPIAYALPITIYEYLVLRVHERSTVGLSKNSRSAKLSRIAVKYYGFCMVLATIAGLYWLIPEYRDPMYQTFFGLAQSALPFILIFSFFYFIWMDTRQTDPEDDYWHTGLFFLGRFKEYNPSIVAKLARGWLVKAFFLPLMAHFLYNETAAFAMTPISWDSPFYVVYDQIIRFILIADLIPACIGYAMTIKLLDTHIRTADDSFRGWFFCLVCYPPFWSVLFYSHYLPYMDGFNWSNWLGESPVRWIWAAAIIICMTIYASASVCFGTRWSNLTYRGLMCSGPYRISKHPAYFFKNISWWLIGIPFIVEGTLLDSIKQVLFSMGVNYVYYQRAITEEKHLSRYPEYRAYALWMNEHSPLRFIHRRFPTLKYDPARYGYPTDKSAASPASKNKRKK